MSIFQILHRRFALQIALSNYLCDIHDGIEAERAYDILKQNQDGDIGLSDLGLVPLEYVEDSISASDVEDMVSRTVMAMERVFAMTQSTREDRLSQALVAIANGIHDPAALALETLRSMGNPQPVIVATGHALAELLDQIEGIGVSEWHGAEGLDLGPARMEVARFKAMFGAKCVGIEKGATTA